MVTVRSHPAASRHVPLVFALVLTAAAAPAGLRAQGVTTAAVTGRVVDASGSPLEDVRIETLHTETGARAATLTDAEGRYYLPNLRPGGPYTLTASKLGWTERTREELSLALGQAFRADFTLTEEAVELPALEVQVAPDPDFNPSRMGTITLLDQETVERLPTITRNFVDFSALSPLAKVSEEGISVAGQNLRFNNIQVDGALSQDVFGLSPSGVAGGRANARPVPLEAIQQFQVLVAPYDVRQSGFTGGVLNAVTKSGTNEWKGTGFGFWRDEALLGQLVVDGTPQTPDELDDLFFGGTLGGPIVRDRVHFFAAGEWERRRQPPSGFHVGLVDPARTGLAPDSVTRLRALLDGLGADAGTALPVTLDNELANAFLRLDARLAPGHELMLRHNFVSADDDPAPNRLPGEPYDLSSNGTTTSSTSHSTVLQLLSTLGDGWSNDLLVNLQFIRDETLPLSTYPRVEVDIRSEAGEALLERRVRAGAEFFAHDNRLDQDILQITDHLTRVLGRHRLLVGASVERFAIRRLFQPGSLGSYRFDSLADLEANRPSLYSINLPLPGTEDPAVNFDVFQWAGYLQDEWTVSDRVSLRLGLRADIPTIPDVPTANPGVEEAFGVRTDRMPSGHLLLSPRFGFNARLGEEGATQLRGGAGLFAGRPPFVWLANAYQNTGLETVFLACEGANAPPLDPAGPPPTACLDGTGASLAGQPTINFFDPDFRFPQDFKVSLGVDQKLPLGLVGSVEGLFTKAVNQIFLEDVNIGPAVSDPTPEGGYTDGYGFGPDGRDAFGPGTSDGFAPGRVSDDFAQAIRIGNADENFAYAVTAELKRRFAGGFGFRVAYSYSRSADTQSLLSDDATSNFGLTPVEGDPNDPKRQPALFDRPHKVLVNLNGRFLESLGGTEVSLLYVGQSGRPYTYVYQDDLNGDGYPGTGRGLDLYNDAIFVPIGSFDFPGRGISSILMEQLIAREPCLQEHRNTVLFRNACRAPWSDDLDLRVVQNLRTGPARVQVIFDMLNVLNFLNEDWGRVETMNQVVQLVAADERACEGFPTGGEECVPSPSDPLIARYVGPLQRGEGGGIRAAVPTTFAVPSSVWQAQLGVRVTF